jgi:hypothetical protein
MNLPAHKTTGLHRSPGFRRQRPLLHRIQNPSAAVASLPEFRDLRSASRTHIRALGEEIGSRMPPPPDPFHVRRSCSV